MISEILKMSKEILETNNNSNSSSSIEIMKRLTDLYLIPNSEVERVSNIRYN